MPDYQQLESTNLCESPARPAHDNDRDSDAERRTNAQSRNRDIWPKHPGLK
ncbi:hypothetical protein [Corynebacterium tuberculostearicum]|uniref:hypothetical protein n=1 Tax=Corynebacterium tuberculostearicum TaxID=38304 RepID=UPI002025C8A8|nr:hypothetical protein [Corynebacterium tuberculostearicum]MCG7454517.1 hypothetical protein [Corynebacterium tuberculostearicum]